MEIELISKTPDFLTTAFVAARTCYSKYSPNELLKQDISAEDKVKLLRHVITNKHLSVVEHCQISFAVKNVSRTLLAQFTRHRIGLSFSVQSQRYVSNKSDEEHKIFNYVIPESIKNNEDALLEYKETMGIIQASYDQLLKYNIPKQDARFILPGGICTNLVTSFNLRSFLDVYEKRVVKKGAQWEIVNMLKQMRNLLVEAEPWLAEFLPK